MKKLVAILLTIAWLAAPSFAQRIQTSTRLVTIFTRLENELALAHANHDDAKLDRLLATDFEEWTPEPPGDPKPRADWLKQAGPAAGAQIRQMSARDLGQHVAVKFVRVGDHAADFIVDIWQKNGDQWHLMERYRSKVDAAPYSEDVKPTGKN